MEFRNHAPVLSPYESTDKLESHLTALHISSNTLAFR
jgi:hypothetical protein